MNLGLPEIILILVVALLFFGPSRLPSLGKSVGEAIRGFKKGISDPQGEDQKRLNSSDSASMTMSKESEEAVEKEKDRQNT